MLGVGRHGPTGPRVEVDQGSAPGSEPLLDPEATDALAVIAAVEGVGPVTLERLLSACGGSREILAMARGDAGAADLRAASRDPDEGRPSLTAPAATALAEVARAPERILASMREAGVHALALGDPGYPARLRQIELPPRVLFVRGADEALESAQAVAVVGTRRSTAYGRGLARAFGRAVAEAGWVLCSGLARGIDGEAPGPAQG